MKTAADNAVVFPAPDFEGLFPFHIALDRSGLLTRVGRSMRKIAPAAQPTVPFADVFETTRLGETIETAWLPGGGDRLRILRDRASGTRFRGQMQVLGDELFFFGAPWLSDMGELQQFDLKLSDFALHDPTLDLLQVLQLQKVAAEDLHRLAARLREQSAQLEQAGRMKDTFLASLSHELRTPLTGILGLSETLIEGVAGPLNEKQSRYLDVIRGSGRRLLTMVNDLLDLAKIAAGQEQIVRHECPLGELCSASLEAVAPLAEKRRQRVEFTNLIGETRVRIDGRRIKQALDNLLENASKFTPEEGEFGLRVSAEGDTLCFEVWDRGIGIAVEDMPRLFEAFRQIDGRLARRFDGAGLGLALVKALTEMHAGRVEVASERGRGSQFRLLLPTALISVGVGP